MPLQYNFNFYCEQLNWIRPGCLGNFMRFCVIFWYVFILNIYYGFDLDLEKAKEKISRYSTFSVVADSYWTKRWYSWNAEVDSLSATKPSFAGSQPLASDRQVDSGSHHVQSANSQLRMAVPMVQSDEWKTRSSLPSLWRTMGPSWRSRSDHLRPVGRLEWPESELQHLVRS